MCAMPQSAVSAGVYWDIGTYISSRRGRMPVSVYAAGNAERGLVA